MSIIAEANLTIDWTQIILAFMAMLGLWVPIWLNSRRAAVASTEAKVVSTEAKVAAVEAKVASTEATAVAKETHDAVNHRVDKLMETLAQKNAEVLRTAIAEARAEGIKQTEDTIKAVVLAPRAEAAAVTEEAEAVKKLEEIEKHTETKAVNTAKTEEKVSKANKKPK